MPQYNYEIGAALESMTNVELLLNAIPFAKAPKPHFYPFSSYVGAASRKVIGRGLPVAEWTWGFVRRELRDALRAYCTGPSAEVYIRTSTNDNQDEYKVFSCTMIWPQDDEKKDARRRMEFTLRFINLVEIEDFS